MAMKFDYKKNYEASLLTGQEFQDHCTYLLWNKLNITISNFQSKKYQYKIGENLQGFEIKFDRNFQSTGNLWIETEQRRNPEQSYYKAGVFQKDNAWMYCIGDYEVLYLFPKKILQNLYQAGTVQIRENKLKTSKGFLLTTQNAEKYCATKIEA